MTDILQRTEVMQTHLGCYIQDEHVNDWTLLAGSEINLETQYSYPPSSSPFDYEQAYWGYRGQAGMQQFLTDAGVNLDGTSGYVTFSDNYDLPGTTNFTLGMWIMPDTLPASGAMLFDKFGSVGGNGGWRLLLGSTGSMTGIRGDNTAQDTATSSAGAIVAGTGQWQWVVMTYDGSNIRVYVNAQQVASIASTRSLPGNALAFTMGRNSAGAAGFFDGRMYGAFLANAAFSQPTLQSIYDSATTVGQSLYFSQILGNANTQSFWTLSEVTGTTATDLDSNAFNGTYTGGFTLGPAGSISWFGLGSTNRIARYRIGDGSSGDRQIWGQVIYSPINAQSQWTTWSVVYSGSHYAIDVYRTTANTINIVHAKSDGLYLNNSLKISLTGIIRIHCIPGRPGSLYFIRVSQDSIDGKRVMETYIVDDITAGSPTAVYDKTNYRHPHQELVAQQWVSGGSNFMFRVRSLPYSAPSIRKTGVSDDLIQDWVPSANYISDVGEIYSLRGASGRAGTKVIDRMWLSSSTTFTDGRSYLFFTERHLDSNNNALSNLHSPAFYTTTGYALDGWTEPQPLGFSLWEIAGAVQYGQYIIVAGNGLAYYKTLSPTQVDLSNYAISAQLSLPRGLEKATGTVTLANPNDAVGQLLGMASDTLSPAPQKRVKVIVGTRRFIEEGWVDVEVNDWWISEAHRQSEDNVKHIELRLGDFWHRLESDFRDPYYFPGQLSYEDWAPGGANSLANWYPASGVAATLQAATDADGQDYYRMVTPSGFNLCTRWKGAHGSFGASFTLASGGGQVLLVFRWVDTANYWRINYSGTSLSVQQVVNGTATTLATTSVTANLTSFTMSVQFRWGWIRYSLNATTGSYQETGTVRNDQFGFVGVWAKSPGYAIAYADFKDYEVKVTTSSLVKMLLIHAGYTQFSVSDDLRDIEQLAILWGPQSDVPTPATALQRLLEGNRQDVVWQPYSFNVRGQITIDQFEDTDPEYDIDEEIISVDQADISDVRPNVVLVDGQEDSWTEYSRSDLATRGAAVNEYLDLPDLTTLTDVRAKAQEEKTLAAKGNSLGGLCVWRPWFQRMDSVTWRDHDDNVYLARIEGMDLDLNQGGSPYQHVQMDLAPISLCDPEADETGLGPGSGGSGDNGEVVDPDDFLANDQFVRDNSSSSWGTAGTGGAWTLTGTAADFSITSQLGRISTITAASIRAAVLGSGPNTTNPIYIQSRWIISNFSDDWVTNGIIFRYIDASNYYYVTLRVGADKSARLHIYKRVAGVETLLFNSGVINGVPIYSTTHVNVKVWVSGTSPTKIYVKVWRTSESEPDAWQYSEFDSSSPMQAAGKVGVRVYLSSAATHTVTVDHELFRVTNAPAA